MANSVLVISDLQTPFHHPDAIAFLREVKRKYKCERVVSIGDETDNMWAGSYAKAPEAPNPSLELENAIQAMQELYRAFPICDVINSNHLERIQKSAALSNIPKQVLKPTEEIFKAPKGWKWSRSLKMKLGGHYCFFTHGRSKDLSWARSLGMNVIQGHHHELFQIIYFRPNDESKSTKSLRWSMFVGSLIDNNALAFSYNKNNKNQPILGCAVIAQGYPILVPMFLDQNGKWTGKI
jgi:hypothetical protein